MITTILLAFVVADAPVQVNVNANGLNIPGDAANESSIAVDQTAPNRIAIGWRQFDSISSSFREAGFGHSDDGGRTWSVGGVLQNGTFRSDPVLTSLSDGTFIYYSLQNNFTCDAFRSTNGGASWTGPTRASGGDKAWVLADATGSIGEGHVYAQWSTAAGPFTATPFVRSTNGGLSFEAPVAMSSPPPRWGTMAIDADGVLFVGGVQGSPFDSTKFIVTRSTTARDASSAVTFDPPVFVEMGGGMSPFDGPNPAGLLGQVWLDVDRSGGPRDGWLYMLCSIDPPATRAGDDPLDVHFVRSTDGGATWSAPKRVNDDAIGAWNWFGTMSVAPNGRIDVVWNGTAPRGPLNISQLFYSFSDDGGDTWSPRAVLSNAWDSFVGWPQQNKIGDYYHMHSDLVGADLACAMTLNGEQDVFYVRIGDRDCNQNGIGDAIDLANGALKDCDGDGIPDLCAIAAGTVGDRDGDGIPDSCDAAADLDNDGDVDAADLAILLGAWGGSGGDVDGNGTTDAADLALLLGAWS